MFHVLRKLLPRHHQSLIIHDRHGHIIGSDSKITDIITDYFKSQFNDSAHAPVPLTPYLVRHPITPVEVQTTLSSLKNTRAPGPDHISGENLKRRPPQVRSHLAPLINRAVNTATESFSQYLNHGVVIALSKPNKPRGPCTSLRPITLLTTTRKTLSLIKLSYVECGTELTLSYPRTRGDSDEPEVWQNHYGPRSGVLHLPKNINL
uniref:AlNc14C45G3687 protein n=1 Tax=Albugo laibachii Nc14 TaxID=890382 RepID=F0WAG0_9STRA|nr:AlNc14C45G3687 [Albugo laibachii Nc14]|eukprot:CCA18131.1 AlNc14C45G3687 [Albugo laibachii Nc14]